MAGYIVFDSWPSKKTSSLLLAMEGVLCRWKVHVLRALQACGVHLWQTLL